VEGRRRALNALVRDDVYRIGREALVNSIRHSQASSVEIAYASYLRLVVRDDGCGIDPEVLSSGRDGHWGLTGMQERAARIDGCPQGAEPAFLAARPISITVERCERWFHCDLFLITGDSTDREFVGRRAQISSNKTFYSRLL